MACWRRAQAVHATGSAARTPAGRARFSIPGHVGPRRACGLRASTHNHNFDGRELCARDRRRKERGCPKHGGGDTKMQHETLPNTETLWGLSFVWLWHARLTYSPWHSPPSTSQLAPGLTSHDSTVTLRQHECTNAHVRLWLVCYCAVPDTVYTASYRGHMKCPFYAIDV